tara:strand:+ start:1626 stop:1868 length:243 start_codon:yes stop_codon:yes gene_type:complete
VIENLNSGIGKEKGKIINYLAPSLYIKHKNSGLKYTIKKIIASEGKPIIIAYRYYSKPDDVNKKVFIEIEEKDFKDYEAV